MGLFRRFRAGTSSSTSGAQPDQKASVDPAKNQQSSGQKFVRRTPSLNLLNGQPRASSASTAPSSPTTPAPLQPQRTGGKLPWSSRKKSSEPPTPDRGYEDLSAPPPRSGLSNPSSPSLHSQSGRHTPDPTNIPTIATSSYDSPPLKTPSRQSYGPRPPSRPPPPSASVHSRPGLTVSPGSHASSNGYAGISVHHRSPSQATVISIDSTFTGGSRSSLEWKQEGGILGKLGFEDDWGGLDDTLSSQNANGQPSAPPQRPMRSDLREDSESTTSAAARTSPVKKITTAFSSRNPSLTTNVPAAPLVLSPTLVDTTEELESRSSHQGDPRDLPDEDKRSKMWTRGPKSSRSRASDVPDSIPPSSPPKPRRSSSQTGDQAAALRRPSSNLFHNPFGRTTSRTSLPLDQAAGTDDGSFQLKSFRHISGASGADSKLDQYFNLSRASDAPLSSGGNTPSAGPSPRHEVPPTYTTPLTAPPPRPRLSSATGSSGSQQNRVSIAEFRKNIRRPSSSMLVDAADGGDDDDMPLSMSRAQLRAEAAIHRNSSAVSLGSDAPSPSPSMSRLMPSVSPMADKERKLPSSSPLSRPQSVFLLGANDAVNESVKPRRSSNDPNLARAKNERTWPDSPTASEASTAASPTTPTGLREPIRGPRRRDSLKNIRKPLPAAPEPHTMPANAVANALSQSTSPVRPTFAAGLSDAPGELEGIKLPPRPDEIPDEPVRGSRPPSRSTTLSPGLSAVLDEPLRRISGLWAGAPNGADGDKEEAFDPSIVAAIGNGPPPIGMGERQRTASESNRMSIYDRLNSVTSVVSSVVPSPMAIMKGEDPNKLFIPPVPDSPEKRVLPQSPASDRTASPVRVPPPMTAPPAPPPTMPHSSFGRPSRKQPEKVRTRKEAVGWDTSSEDEDDVKKSSPVIAAPRPLKSAMKNPSRTDLMSTSPAPAPAASADDSEPDEPLRQVRARASSRQELRSVSRQQEQPPSRGDMRPIMSSSGSRQDLRVDTGVTKPSVPNGPSAGHSHSTRPNGGRSVSSSHVSVSSHTTATPRNVGLTKSSSKWSLSDSSPTGSEQPSRPPSRPGSRARMHRVASSDRLRAMPGGVRTSHHQTSPPTGGPLAALNHDARHSASPASSQSALTGDSSMQQPSTPRSNTDSRRSWGADARLRVSSDANEARVRPPSQFDWMNAANGAMPQFPGMDPAYAAQAQAAMMNKQQFYQQWMAAAQAHFDDAWERASNVSNAQTLPGNNPMMGQMPMGYSYGAFPGGMASMPVPPSAMFNMYGGYGYGMPAMPFPQAGMSSGMSSASGMTGMGGMGMAGGMYSYAPPAQSVFGGEFGPPVQAPFATEPVAGHSGGGGSPNRRSRHLDGGSVRPQSVTSGDIATPPRRQQRRASGMALSEAGAPVSAWRGSRYELNEQTPRARRSSHANANAS